MDSVHPIDNRRRLPVLSGPGSWSSLNRDPIRASALTGAPAFVPGHRFRLLDGLDQLPGQAMASGLERPDSVRPAILPDFDGMRHRALNLAAQGPARSIWVATLCDSFGGTVLPPLTRGAWCRCVLRIFFYTPVCKGTLVAMERMQPVFHCRTLNPPI